MMEFNEVHDSDQEYDYDEFAYQDDADQPYAEEAEPANEVRYNGKTAVFKARDFEETYFGLAKELDLENNIDLMIKNYRKFARKEDAIKHYRYYCEVIGDYKAACAREGAHHINNIIGRQLYHSKYPPSFDLLQCDGSFIGWRHADLEEFHKAQHDIIGEDRTLNQLSRPLFLRVETTLPNGDVMRHFTYFPIASMACDFIRGMQTGSTNTNLHEVFDDKLNHIRSVYFDLDDDAAMPATEAEFMSDVMEFNKKFLDVLIGCSDIADKEVEIEVYTSHGLTAEGLTRVKHSAHVVYRNVFFNDSIDIARFAALNFKGMRYLDMNVYNRSHSLRMYGFGKINKAGSSERPKILHSSFTVPLDDIQNVNTMHRRDIIQSCYEAGIVNSRDNGDQAILNSLITYVNVGELDLAIFMDGAPIRDQYLRHCYSAGGYASYLEALLKEPDVEWVYNKVLNPSYDYFDSKEYDADEPFIRGAAYDYPVTLPICDDATLSKSDYIAAIIHEIENAIVNGRIWDARVLMQQHYKKNVPEAEVAAVLAELKDSCREYDSFDYVGTSSLAPPQGAPLTPQQEAAKIDAINAQIAAIKAVRVDNLSDVEKEAWDKLTKVEKGKKREERDNKVAALKQSIKDLKEQCKHQRATIKPYLSYFINFARKKRDTHNCSVCRRTHENDNRTMFWAVRSDYMVIQCCYHNKEPNKQKSIVLRAGTYKPPPKPYDQIIEDAKKDFVPPVVDLPANVPKTPNEIKCIASNVLDQSYVFNHTLVVDSPPGTGKTQNLKRYISDNSSTIKKVVIVAFRRSYTKDIKSKFSEFNIASYLDPDYLKADIIIIQYESLHKLMKANRLHFDLMVLDEFEQIISCSDNIKGQSGTNSIGSNFDTLAYLLKITRKVIVMDATIGPKGLIFLEYKRRGFEMLINTHKSHAGKNATMVEYEGDFDEAIMADLEAGKRLVIPTTLPGKGEKIENRIHDKFPHLKILRIDGTNSGTKPILEALEDVNVSFSYYDVLIYTSTISAGVSYTVKHFDAVYQYIDTRCGDVDVSIQMLFRVRDISSGEYYCYIKPYEMTHKLIPLRRVDIVEIYYAALAQLDRDNVIDIEMLYRKVGHTAGSDMVEAIKNDHIALMSRSSAGSYEPDAPVVSSADQNRNPALFTNEYFELEIAKWLSKSFNARNYVPYFIYFLIKFGFNIETMPKGTFVKDMAAIERVKKITAERDAVKMMQITDLVPTQAEKEMGGDMQFARYRIAIENFEEDNMGKRPDEIPIEKRKDHEIVSKLYHMSYDGPATIKSIKNAIKIYGYYNTVKILAECSNGPEYIRVITNQVCAPNNMKKTDVDVFAVRVIDKLGGKYKIELAIDLLRILGYDVDGVGCTVDELNAARCNSITKSSLLNMRSIIQEYLTNARKEHGMLINGDIRGFTNTSQINIMTYDYKKISGILSSIIGIIGMKIGLHDRNGDAIVLKWAGDMSMEIGIGADRSRNARITFH